MRLWYLSHWRFLKEMSVSISSALTLIFQASYDQGQVPDDWKGAYITPLFKKGDMSKASNYRPVSLTSLCSKAMEHIVHSHNMKLMEEQKILSDQQHGFRKRRSCDRTKKKSYINGTGTKTDKKSIFVTRKYTCPVVTF